MQERIERLERANRLLSAALVAALSFALGCFVAGERSAGPLPRAFAAPELKAYDELEKRPLVVFLGSDSGSTLYEYRRQPDGSYKRLIWN